EEEEEMVAGSAGQTGQTFAESVPALAASDAMGVDGTQHQGEGEREEEEGKKGEEKGESRTDWW
ncbi:hypothetical protein TARUN_3966, partial [Trichoderma arundinaceum]